MPRITFRYVLITTLLASLSGCASVYREPDLASLHALVEQHSGGPLIWTDATNSEAQANTLVEDLLKQSLTPDSAVQIALLRNPRLQIEYARLGIAQADVYEASRISNPNFSITTLDSHQSGVPNKLDAGLTQNFTDLLLLSARKRLALGEYERTQQSIAAAILNVTLDTRAAWYRCVSAQQIATLRETVAKAAQTSAELAHQFHAAGNINLLTLRLEQASATQARLQATHAQAEAMRARFTLQQLLGLSTENHWDIADHLPLPIVHEDQLDTLLEQAHKRLELSAAQQEVTLLEQTLGVTKRYRWLGRVDVGVATEHEPDRTKLYGPSLSLQLPLFNQGQGAQARATALLEASRARLQILQREIDNDIRLSFENVKFNRSIVEEYRLALIPQREAVVASTQENVNFMLTGVFDLLLAKQQEYEACQSYIEAVRDYWLARMDLMRAVGAYLPSTNETNAATRGPEDIVQPSSDNEHEHHSDHQATDTPKKDDPAGEAP